MKNRLIQIEYRHELTEDERKALRRCYMTWDLLRTYGYAAEDLYFVSEPRAVGIALVLKHETFSVMCAKDVRQDVLEEAWQTLAQVLPRCEQREISFWAQPPIDKDSVIAALLSRNIMPGPTWAGPVLAGKA